VLLNITPDHLDRYDGFEGYAASKIRLFGMQSAPHLSVVSSEIDAWESVRDARGGGAFLADYLNTPVGDLLAGHEAWPALRGPHNLQNAEAAAVVCHHLGIDHAIIREGLCTYSSLPHRMQRVRERNGVLFINDSKATNAASTAPALAAWPAVDGKPRIHWILGGLAKSDDLDECAPGFPNVAHAYTIGEAGPLFARLLREAGKPVNECELLVTAVTDAAARAKPGDVVLLSPACASFDQFRDFEARGDAFAASVAALGETTDQGGVA
jgi:UDP-N-acetylmuramoylalanine--D-glutamate ligase